MFRRHFLEVLTSATLGYQTTSFPLLRSRLSAQLPPGFGLAYGPYRQHQSPRGLQPTEAEIREDLKLLKEILPEPHRIRIYSSFGAGGLAAILAAEEGFLVTLGAWINEDLDGVEANEKELAALSWLVPLVRPELVIVGNETLLRINTDDKITDKRGALERFKNYLRRAKAALPNTLISTGEPWSSWILDEAGAELVDLVSPE